MSGEGSFPHQSPEPPEDDASEGGEARVLEFPSDEGAPPADSMVPSGTWADEPAEDDVERLLRPAGVERWEGGEVVAFPSPTSTQRRKRPSFVASSASRPEPSSEERDVEVTGEQPTHDVSRRSRADESRERLIEPGEVAAADRPRFLASELLKEDWFPRTPLRRTLRWGSVVLGVAGVAAALGLGGLEGNALGLGALFALCAAAGVAPLSSELRGGALAITGAAGAGWLGYLSTAGGAGAATPLLIGCVTLTVAALLFRAAHRVSKLARVLVGVGLAATAGYLFLSGGLDGMVVESMDWQSWVVPISRLVLVAVVLLAALTFLDPNGHGGAWHVGFAFLAWLALDAGGAVALAAWPLRAPATALGPDRWLVIGALPLFAAVTAGGLCQLLALVSHHQHARRPAARAVQR